MWSLWVWCSLSLLLKKLLRIGWVLNFFLLIVVFCFLYEFICCSLGAFFTTIVVPYALAWGLKFHPLISLHWSINVQWLLNYFLIISLNHVQQKRFQNDMAVNNNLIDVLQDQRWEPIPWKKLQVGDIVRVSILQFGVCTMGLDVLCVGIEFDASRKPRNL